MPIVASRRNAPLEKKTQFLTIFALVKYREYRVIIVLKPQISCNIVWTLIKISLKGDSRTAGRDRARSRGMEGWGGWGWERSPRGEGGRSTSRCRGHGRRASQTIGPQKYPIAEAYSWKLTIEEEGIPLRDAQIFGNRLLAQNPPCECVPLSKNSEQSEVN